MSEQDPSAVANLLTHFAQRVLPNLMHLVGKTVVLTGANPFNEDDIGQALLPETEWTTATFDYFSPDATTRVDYLIIGEYEYKTDWIEASISSNPDDIVVLPQEGFLDYILFGYDWWNKHVDLLNSVADRHEGLQYAKGLAGFAWPDIDAPESTSGSTGDEEFATETALRRQGYQITGLNRARRWTILIGDAIPALGLREVVETIAMLVRTRKAQRGGRARYANAIAEWEHDLARLRTEVYDRSVHQFRWPSTEP